MSFGVTSSLASCEDLKVIDNNTCQIENFEIRGENKFAISRMIVIGFAWAAATSRDDTDNVTVHHVDITVCMLLPADCW